MSKLEGFKQIADHLGVSMRTAREWAELHGLPVDMVRGRALSTEERLDGWLAAERLPYPEHLRRLREQRGTEKQVAA